MGQVGSTGEFTQEGIKQIKDVKEADVMMNLIFRYMAKQINMNDFLKLSQPETCKEYVISLAEHMSSQFSHLQITPYREKNSDILLFTKYSELDPSKKSETHSEEEKTSLCLLLSYYYTRIFQIYGALAITLLNDISSSQTMSQSMGLDRSINRTKGSTMVSANSLIGGTRGGADMTEIQDSSFVFLSSYFLNKDNKETYQLKRGWQTKYDERNMNGARVYFDKIETITSSSSVVTFIGRFIIYPPATRDRYIILDVSAKWVTGTRYDISLTYKSLKTSDTPSITLPLPASLKDPITITRKKEEDISSYEVKVKRNNGTASMGVPQYFEGVVQELIKDFPSKGKSTSETSEETQLNEEGVSNPLKISIIKKALEERRTVGHCIARALQLLRTIPATSKKGASFESDICMETFTFTARTHKGKISTSSNPRLLGTPEYGKSLMLKDSAGSRGIHPLVQLFYDTIHIGSPQILMGDTAFTEYKAFMEKMADLYWDDVPDDKITPTMTIHQGIAEISNKRDEAMCTTELRKKNGVIKINPTIVKVDEVSRVVRELYIIQVNHAKKCGEIFRLLFNITYDEKRNPLMISLNPSLLKGGFKELRRINGLARNVLIDYYSMCEQKYVQGVNLIVRPMRAASATSAASAASATSATSATSPPSTVPLTRSATNGTPIPSASKTDPLLQNPSASKTGPLLQNPFPPATPATGSTIPRLTRQRSTGSSTGGFTRFSGGTRKRHVMRQ